MYHSSWSNIMAEFNHLAELSFNHVIAKAVCLAAEIKLNFYLSAEAVDIVFLARELKFNQDAFKSFLRVLSAHDVVKLSDDEKTVTATEVTGFLDRLLSPHILKSSKVFDNLSNSLQKNTESWSITYDKRFYPYLLDHPNELKQFEDWCSLSAKDWLTPIFELYDFGMHKSIIDIAGGNGQFIRTCLNKYPHLAGTLFEQESVIKEVVKNKNDLLSQINFVSGDFFKAETIPGDGECYTLCRTLLNWSNSDAKIILNNCYQAIPKGSKLLIIDFVLPHSTHPHYKRAVMGSLNLLLLINSMNRSKQEWLDLVNATPFKFNNFYITDDSCSPEPFMPLGIIELIRE